MSEFDLHVRAAKIYGWNGTREREIGMDEITRVLTTIDYPHHEIHSGSHFYITGHTTLGNNAGVDDILRVKLVTPDTGKWAHFQWAISSTGTLEATLHEAAAGGMTGGGPVTPLNNNRNSPNTSGVVITSGVIAPTTAGTLIDNAKWGASGFKVEIGGGSGRDDEIILKQNTIYLRTFLSTTADNIIQFKASWYEHQNQEA